ncbi:hypothetical protein LZ31DRAFT_176715 [Colletotrichum somersetense]|nr:hypothetical protein LZ31DRAFT_176715 [Colletotrichum somersetense]
MPEPGRLPKTPSLPLSSSPAYSPRPVMRKRTNTRGGACRHLRYDRVVVPDNGSAKCGEASDNYVDNARVGTHAKRHYYVDRRDKTKGPTTAPWSGTGGRGWGKARQGSADTPTCLSHSLPRRCRLTERVIDRLPAGHSSAYQTASGLLQQ